MSQNPANLAIRFLLELLALISIGYWGWFQVDGPLRLVWALLAPLLAAALWGIFRVPGDPGHAPVAVPGPARLILEAGFFGFALWAQLTTLATPIALVFGAVVLLHYAISYDRVFWLLKR